MRSIRAAAILHNIPCITTIQGAREAVNGMETCKDKELTVQSLPKNIIVPGETYHVWYHRRFQS